jgi:hypothetical protein
MVKTLNTPSNSLHKRQSKDKYFKGQMERVFAAFTSKPSTMLMVSIETGVLRANICRYVAKWQKSNSIQLLEQGLCKISKHRAGYYTTDNKLFTQPLKLF